ncbi:acyl-CoA dehydrogenase family protein [Jatrophihabitans sp.]|uniref:acyl-CoA dehydrogenase family protein n=1 Tax=Jatrophihabitans sp. TaxID=1932789 RepID=UPI0030C74CA0|nr:putative Acyl-CoA dehydrogenase [Jatrophihabitans sp.]
MSDALIRPPALPELTVLWSTPEREELLKQVRSFARDEVLPVANQLDPQRGLIPTTLLDRLAELGYFGITVDREHGGLGLGAFEYCLVAEELARAWMSVASIIARGQGLGTGLADDSRRAELLERSARGSWIGALALSEPGAGSDLAGVETTATREGDEWVISGHKRWCGNAEAADFIQVLVRTRPAEPDEPRSAGLQTLLLEKERGSFPAGLTGTPIDKIGYHGFLTWDLVFDQVRVPLGNVVTTGGGQDSSFAGVGAWLDVARVQTAARAVGLAQAAVEDCTLYLQEREQFGHPIADFQALRFALADMASAVEQSRAHYRQVAHLIDRGADCTTQAAMVKLRATEMAAEVTSQAMQLHGGNGYTTERAVERHWRDARLTTIFEGTSEIQRKIISDALLPRPS